MTGTMFFIVNDVTERPASKEIANYPLAESLAMKLNEVMPENRKRAVGENLVYVIHEKKDGKVVDIHRFRQSIEYGWVLKNDEGEVVFGPAPYLACGHEITRQVRNGVFLHPEVAEKGGLKITLERGSDE